MTRNGCNAQGVGFAKSCFLVQHSMTDSPGRVQNRQAQVTRMTASMVVWVAQQALFSSRQPQSTAFEQ